MEIHSRYYSEENQQAAQDSQIQESDRIFELIQGNRVKDLLSFFQETPHGRLYTLVNERNERFNKDLPINFAIKSSANHLVLIMLLRLGARIEDSSESPLLLAARAGLLNLIKILLISGADVNCLDADGYSVLHWACFRRNTLLVRLILQAGNFALHNNDRNKKRISPLGIAIEAKHFELARELLKCPDVDPNLIDSNTHRYLYDLAVEGEDFRICLEMEQAFKRNNSSLITNKLSLKRNFHDLHKYRIEAVLHHQLRSLWLTFRDDPRGAFQSFDDPSIQMTKLPDHDHWQAVIEDGAMDSEGWTWSFMTDGNGEALAVKGNQVIPGGGVFNYIDNYRFRLLIRIHTNNIINTK